MPRKWVYGVGVVVIFFAVFQSPASYLIFGRVEKGKVVEIVIEYSGVSLIPSSTYPRIEFEYQNKTYAILGEENQEFLVGDVVKVIFFENNPAKAKVLTFGGLFVDSIIQLPIGLLIWWALFKSFPNLFDSTNKKLEFDNLLPNHKVRKKENKITDTHIAVRIFIYSLIAIVCFSLLYALWIIYNEMSSGQISYQTGIGIVIVILIILVSIIHKTYKG